MNVLGDQASTISMLPSRANSRTSSRSATSTRRWVGARLFLLAIARTDHCCLFSFVHPALLRVQGAEGVSCLTIHPVESLIDTTGVLLQEYVTWLGNVKTFIDQ
jgi:hypothetical protein